MPPGIFVLHCAWLSVRRHIVSDQCEPGTPIRPGHTAYDWERDKRGRDHGFTTVCQGQQFMC